MPDEFLTLVEEVLLLKVAENTVHTMVPPGEVPTFKVRGQWRFKRDDLDHWIEQQKLSRRDHDKPDGRGMKGRAFKGCRP
jgi:excisionase family DNA binding protein